MTRELEIEGFRVVIDSDVVAIDNSPIVAEAKAEGSPHPEFQRVVVPNGLIAEVNEAVVLSRCTEQ